MAVFTPVHTDDLHVHLAKFNIGTLVSHTGINEGVENTNYMVETTQGKFILTLFERRVSLEDLPFYIEFMEHLNKKGIPSPSVLTARNGQKIIPLRGKLSVMTTFLQGAWPKETTPLHTKAVGETLARMHREGESFTMTRKNSMALKEWQQLIGYCADSVDIYENGLNVFLQKELAYLTKNAPDISTIPHGPVHADLFPDNVFFHENSLSGVIDFYFACTESFMYDVMLAVNAWCFDKDGRLDKDKSTALLTAYHAERPFAPVEKSLLPFFGRAAAVRIIATRLYDILNPKPGGMVTPKDPLEHVRILRFHQQTTSSADYGLAE